MSDATTIKVPRSLRNRLAERAQRDRIPLAQVIEDVLDENEDREFWARVARDHAQISDEELVDYANDAARGDDLSDASDDSVSARDAW